MKKLLIGLLLLSCLSSFANCVTDKSYKVEENLIYVKLLSSEDEANYAVQEYDIECSDLLKEILRNKNEASYIATHWDNENNEIEIPVVYEFSAKELNLSFYDITYFIQKSQQGKIRFKLLIR